jgi:hypothetical protein
MTRHESPETVQAAADIYRMVKDLPAAGLTDEQKNAIAEGQAAADAVAASNDGLGALLVAAEQGRQRNGAGDREILTAMDAVTPFDQARFQDQHRAAWAGSSSRKGDIHRVIRQRWYRAS